ncbi:MAG: sulfatase, partial [Candidatus Eisenbacteria bacterium]|nr:sulfatase [Candidatus Eisenbacteria bacterium]
LLLTIDTIRADATGFGGSRRPTTPFLDSLASTAIVYTNAHSTSSWTVPAVVSMLTGLYPVSHAVVHGAVGRGEIYDQEVIPAELPILAEQLKQLGYRTYAVASNTHLAPEMGYGRGFDRYRCLGFTTADSVTRSVLRWKDIVAGGRGPWFLWIHYYDPHHPYRERRPWFRQFVGKVTKVDGPLLIGAKGSPPKPPRRKSAEAARFVELARGLYDAEVRYTDESIRELFREMPFLADALIVMAGDHGEEFLEHGDVGHCRTLNGESVRVPLFVRHPDGGGAGKSTALVSLIDVPVTIRAAAGAPATPVLAGLSLLDRAALETAATGRSLLTQLERNRDLGLEESIIGPRWKFVINRLTGRMELYDLLADPAESANVARSNTEEATAQGVRLAEFLKRLPPPPAVVERKSLSKEVEAQLRGEGYIH